VGKRLRGPAPPVAAGQYDVFISYSHAADGRLAPALQSGLQRLAKPWYKPRALRVFRDDTRPRRQPGPVGLHRLGP